MDFVIPCETFVRMNHAALGQNETQIPDRPMLRSVRIEHRDGAKYVIATNGKILACELLGETGEPEGFINVINSEKLVAQCALEVPFNSDLKITLASGWGAAMTTLGYFHPDNVASAEDWPDWRSRIPEQPKKAKGAAVFDADSIYRLALSAPSGAFMFPKIIDATQPILVRDTEHENWFGMFLVAEVNKRVEPAEYPEWFTQ